MSEEQTRRSYLKKSAATIGLATVGLSAASGSAAAATDYLIEGYNDTSETGNYAIETGPKNEVSIDGNTDGDWSFVETTDSWVIDVDNVPSDANNEEWEILNADYATITESVNMELDKYTK